MGEAPSRTAVAGLVAFLVVTLSLFGALETLPQWVRGAAQALGTLAGIYLGSQWQAHDQRRTAEGAAKTSILHLVALAKSIQALLAFSEAAKERLREEPPRTIESFQNAVGGVVSGVDAQAKALLAQAEAATSAWAPFIRKNDPFMRQFEEGASRSAVGDGTSEGEGQAK